MSEGFNNPHHMHVSSSSSGGATRKHKKFNLHNAERPSESFSLKEVSLEREAAVSADPSHKKYGRRVSMHL